MCVTGEVDGTSVSGKAAAAAAVRAAAVGGFRIPNSRAIHGIDIPRSPQQVMMWRFAVDCSTHAVVFIDP